MTKGVIVLDADGVLLDYNLAYAKAWEQVFRTYPHEKNANAYWAIDRWAVDRLEGESLADFRGAFDELFWGNIPAVEGSLAACHALYQAGYELICVTALPAKFQAARRQNLIQLGFPIDIVHTVDHADGDVSPKATLVNSIKPAAFVDDYLPYLVGIRPDIHSALILRETEMSPNKGELLSCAASQHTNLEGFARWWLTQNS
ncbi:MAG: HAD family hydrolase [Undibacterium sp.]|uniref:HAD family hydrolase n=1 Tax=Undibacterium sp. TaxID=1914977 RepID=UPI0027268028|nr:HAD family hydrolase [Undibacterium sp.]MDO8651683.1 HAD family hydrolase [Undibacterium sp.]